MGEIWSECAVDGVATIACIPVLVGQLYNILFSAAGAVAVFFIVWGGFKLIRSGGDPKQLEGARQSITYAIIGLIIILMSYFIIYSISFITGIECIKVFSFSQCATEASGDADSTTTTSDTTDTIATP